MFGVQPATNEFTDVLAFTGFRIAAGVDADQPRAGSAADDLASFSNHIASKNKRAAHVSHTRPLLKVGFY
jgi:hypothetical protein